MYERDPRRAARLVSFVQSEIEDYANGFSDVYTPTEELGKYFNYSTSYIQKVLRESGIPDKKTEAQFSREQLPFPLDSEMAWLLGYLSASSTPRISSNNSSSITIAESVPEREEKLKEVCERHLVTTPKTYTKQRWGNEYREVRIYDASVQRRLGGILNREEAPETIQRKYPRILKKPGFTWRFIEGVFEAKGSVGANSILFTGENATYAVFLLDLLDKVGISDAHIQFTNKTHEHIVGVAVRSWRSLQTIAQNIQSVHPASQEKLDKLLQHKVREWKQPSADDIYSLLINAIGELGPEMNMKKFREYLKKLDNGISESTVVRILGKGTYSTARFNINDFVRNYNNSSVGNREDAEKKAQTEVSESGECIHRWILESPNGFNTVGGKCKKCGLTRQFKASSYDDTLTNWQAVKERELKERALIRGKVESI